MKDFAGAAFSLFLGRGNRTLVGCGAGYRGCTLLAMDAISGRRGDGSTRFSARTGRSVAPGKASRMKEVRIRMVEPIDSLRERLPAEYSEENMKAISARIIHAYKRGPDPLGPRAGSNRLFMKRIVHFHPDKRLQRIREIEELHRSSALGGLERLARAIGLDGVRPPVVGFEYEETCAYGREDFEELREDEPEEYGFIEAVRAELFGATDRSVCRTHVETASGARHAQLLGTLTRGVVPAGQTQRTDFGGA